MSSLESEQASVAEIELASRMQLIEHRNESIRLAAKRLFANSSRSSVIADYHSVLQQSGEPSRGESIFRRECSACHHIRDVGYEVGPNLAALPSRDTGALLTNVLDPNRFVDPEFLQYMIVDKSGRSFAGKIVSETPTSITVTSGKGVHDTILRTNIDEIECTGKSLMPEGFEKTITKEEMADLIAFLHGLANGSGEVRAPLPKGTSPGAVEP
jgi:putative heme-binding domain-containing protein